MSEHRVELNWNNTGGSFAYKDYSRNHTWKFENGTVVEASAAVEFLGDAACVDPEAAFTASLASCHALTFLAIAAMQNLRVESYRDDAVGFLGKDPDTRRPVITRVELHPEVVFGDVEVSREQLEELHHQSHEECFLANSVKCEITTVLA